MTNKILKPISKIIEDYTPSEQKEISTKAVESNIHDEKFKEQFIKWNTFMKENYDIFATWYLGLNLYLFQKIMLHLMGKTVVGIIIASRGINDTCSSIKPCEPRKLGCVISGKFLQEMAN